MLVSGGRHLSTEGGGEEGVVGRSERGREFGREKIDGE